MLRICRSAHIFLIQYLHVYLWYFTRESRYDVHIVFPASFQKSSLRENLGFETLPKGPWTRNYLWLRPLTCNSTGTQIQHTNEFVTALAKHNRFEAKIQKYQQFQRCALPPWLHASHVAPRRSLSVRFAKFAQAKAAEADAFSKCRCVFWMSCDACDHKRKTWNDEIFSIIKSTRHGCFTGKCRARGLSLTSTTLLMPCPRKQCSP